RHHAASPHNTVCKLVHILGSFDVHDDRRPDAALSRLGLRATIGGELVEREERKERTTEIEHDEIVGLENDRPPQCRIERSLPFQVLRAESSDIGKHDATSHAHGDTQTARTRHAGPSNAFRQPRYRHSPSGPLSSSPSDRSNDDRTLAPKPGNPSCPTPYI